MRTGIVALALIFLAAHLPFLPPTLEDIDSINFALGVADFDVARHQPHPPGYPVFIVLGKISTGLLRAAGVPSPEPRGLAVWSAIAGGLLIPLLFALFRGMDLRWGQTPRPETARGQTPDREIRPNSAEGRGQTPPDVGETPLGLGQTPARDVAAEWGQTPRGECDTPLAGGQTPARENGLNSGKGRGQPPRDVTETPVGWGQTPGRDGGRGQTPRAFWATVMVALSPLFWFTALRPLSDTTGLAAAVAAQALIVSAIAGHGGRRALTWGAFGAGLAIGIRSQTFLLTLPLLALALAMPRAGVSMRDRITAVAAATIGIVAWGLPLIVASGGLSSYVAALGFQAGADFSGVVMLWNVRTARVALDAVIYSFLWPWGHPVAGCSVLALAAVGCVRVTWHAPRVFGVLIVAFAPYAIFHLLFHEIVTVRYALPLVVPIAYLAASALELGGRITLAAGTSALAAASLVLSIPAAATYARNGSPTFRAFRAIERQPHGDPDGEPARRFDAVGLHAVARRVAEWEGNRTLPGPLLKGPHGLEWLTLVEEWRSRPHSSVAFVADPRRTDLALFDPQSRQLIQRFTWGFLEPPFVGGARPGNSDLHAMNPPGWMLDRGWALTAEVAGVTAKDDLGPHRKPSVAWIQARPDPATLMIGGRHLGPPADPPVRISMTLNGRPLEAFDVKPGFFFRLITLSAGALAGAGGYLPLAVKSSAADGTDREIPAGLEQFDLQPPGIPMVGAEDGWHEPEYNPLTARSWRWASERATLWVRPIGRDVMLTLTGESPLRYFDAAPTVTVTLAGRPIVRFSPSSDFTQQIVLPADALASANGRVLIESDKWFVPAERGGPPDRRRLALRIYSYMAR